MASSGPPTPGFFSSFEHDRLEKASLELVADARVEVEDASESFEPRSVGRNQRDSIVAFADISPQMCLLDVQHPDGPAGQHDAG
jgi:hypothetical protein